MRNPTFRLVFVPLLISLFALGLLIPHGHGNPWDNYQFIITAIIPLGYFTLATFKFVPLQIATHKSDYGWLTFITIGMLSYYWAINGSLVWYQAFAWLTFVLWMLLFRSVDWERRVNQQRLFGIFGVLFLTIVLPFLYYYFTTKRLDWRAIYGYNCNYVSGHAVSCFAFLLFLRGRSRLALTFVLVSGLLLLLLLLVSAARGSIIAGIAVVAYYLYSKNYFSKHYKKILLGGGLLALLGVLLFANPPELVTELPVLKEFYASKEVDRLYLLRNSFWLFLEHPLQGIGLGNWRLEVYKYGVTEFYLPNDPDALFRLGSHNVYGELLAEVGLVGFLAFVFAFLRAGYLKKPLSTVQKAGLSAVLVYLITAFFYQSATSFHYYFSGIQLLAFCGLGLLTSGHSTGYYSTWQKAILGLLSLSCLAWFIYANGTYQLNLQSHRLARQQPAEAIQLLELNYHPVFRKNYQVDRSFAFYLAQLYQNLEEDESAEYWFDSALQDHPYSENILVAYAEFLLQRNADLEQARLLALRVYRIQPNNYSVNILLLEIALQQQDFSEAERYLASLADFRKQEARLLEKFRQRRVKRKPEHPKLIRWKKKTTARLIALYQQEIRLFKAQRRWNDAAETMERALVLHPQRYHWHLDRIDYLIKAGADKTVWLPLVKNLMDNAALPARILKRIKKLLLANGETDLAATLE